MTTAAPTADELFPAWSPAVTPLSAAQKTLETTYDQIVDDAGGKLPQGDVAVQYAQADGSSPWDTAPIPDADDGGCCSNCAGWGGMTSQLVAGQLMKMGRCRWVDGPIDPRGLCKLALIPPGVDVNDGDRAGGITGPEDGVISDFDIDQTPMQPLSQSSPGVSAVHVNAPSKKLSIAYGQSFLQKDAALRYTLAPWYIPNQLDAHGEWTDPEQLETAVNAYSRLDNRDIYLQHNPGIRAASWTQIMQWPFEVTCDLLNPATGEKTSTTFPPNTVFLGVIWEPWAWSMVLAGKILGFSMGGKTGVLEVDVDIAGDGTVTDAG